MDILWHIPVSKSVHAFRLWGASIMHQRAEAKETGVKDLASYLVVFLKISGDDQLISLISFGRTIWMMTANHCLLEIWNWRVV